MSRRPPPPPASPPAQVAPQEGRVLGYTPHGMPYLQADLPVDVPLALPGERIRYQELGRGAHRARGQLLSVLEAHPARQTPPCPIQATCGSCDRMHLAHDAQIAERQTLVSKALSPLDIPLEPCFPSPLTLGYRRRARFTFAGSAGNLRLGAWQSGSHEVLELGDCPVTDPCLLEARDGLQSALSSSGLPPYDERSGQGCLRHLLLQAHPQTGQVLATLVVAKREDIDWAGLTSRLLRPPVSGIHRNLHPHQGNALQGHTFIHLGGEKSLTMTVGRVPLTFPAGAFSQVNLEVAGTLYQEATDWLLERPVHGAVDLYCGVGALGLHLGKNVAWGLGLELSPQAIEAAQEGARRLGLSNWRFISGDAGLDLERLPIPQAPDAVLVNPPRKGLEAAVRAAILRWQPARLVYVSCDPFTLARDLQPLMKAGYSVARARPFDMFPQTHHVETLVCLSRG